MTRQATGELAATYERISDDREGRELGVERQRKDNLAAATRAGLTVVGGPPYTDNDLSASSKARKERPQYQRLLADARAGRFGVIVASTSSRLTRKPREFEDLIDLATGHGVRFLFVSSPTFDLNTAAGRQVARTLAAQDAAVAEGTAELVAREVAHRAERGEFHGGPRGYGLGADGRTLVQEEADRIRAWAGHILAGGSLRSIATELNAAGVPTVRGTAWRGEVIRKILLAPRVAGLRVHDGIEYPSWSPAIVPAATWRAVRAVLESPDRRLNDSTARKWLGVGLYRCERCHGRTVKTTYNRRGDRAYLCPTCSRTWRADPIDEYVEGVLEGVLAKTDRRTRLLPARAADVDLGGLETEAAAIRANMAELATQRALARGATAAALSAGLAAGERRLAEIQAAIVAAGQADPLAELGDDPVAAYRAFADVRRRQAVVAAVMSVTLGAPIRGRAPWDPERFIDLRPV